jgi:mannose-1-phosphate guanylyltransferase
MSTMPDILVTILAGGDGKRFWPLSTQENPKQFLALLGDRSFLQMSYDLIADIVPKERVLVLTNREYVGKVAAQLPSLPPENIIGEPLRKDTAAALSLAAFLSRARFGNPVMITLTADHLIAPREKFRKTILSAASAAAKKEVLYTIGIPPAYPATGYGYLEKGGLLFEDDGISHYELRGFREKPCLEAACRYLEEGNCLWNSGMFIWQTDTIIAQIRAHLPRHAEVFDTIMPAWDTSYWNTALADAFRMIDPISIDYGVMEKAQDIRCVEAAFTWSDIGGWNSLREYLPEDKADNAHRGHLLTLDAGGNLVYCENPDETVMAIGVNDLVIVRVGGKTLIAHRDRLEDIKKLAP